MAACTFELEDVKSTRAPDAGVDAAGGAGGDGSVQWPTGDGALDTAEAESATDAGSLDADGGGGAAGAAGGAGAAGSGGGPPTTVTVYPLAGLDGDGFLASPDLCGQEVWDYYTQATYKALHVGRDNPCSADTTYRAFLRFSLLPFVGTAPVEAVLRFSYAGKTDPTAGVGLFEVADFQSLAVGDWGAQHRHDFGQVLGPSTAPDWIEVDVVDRVAAALAQGMSAIAFKLQYADEAEDPNGKSRWYGIRASNDGIDNAPRLVVTY